MKNTPKSVNRLRMAIQKSGRLSERTLALLLKCGIEVDLHKDRLVHECKGFPVDLMFVRDDDIPKYVRDGVCELGVVGENVVHECSGSGEQVVRLIRLGFGYCRLSIAVPESNSIERLSQLTGKRIATSYPFSLQNFLRSQSVEAQVVELSGSVEIAPSLGIADAICDLVSSGSTLRSNGLREFVSLFESEALLIQRPGPVPGALSQDISRLCRRIQGVLSAETAKYVMMNAPHAAIESIRRIIPGMEEPSIMPVGLDGSKVAIHAVARETLFWETIERLKSVGASSILVLPIEKVIA